jgi:hypothetical protein
MQIIEVKKTYDIYQLVGEGRHAEHAAYTSSFFFFAVCKFTEL